MNNEFQWRQQMHKLAEPVAPAHDLWPAIAARIDGVRFATGSGPSRSRRALAGWIALAATVVIACTAALVVYRAKSDVAVPGQSAVVRAEPAAPSVTARASAELPRTALDWAQPDDPQLAASAAHLDNASAQLQDALEQRPDAVFLVGLLNRTNAMRLRLMRKAPNA